MPLVTFLKITYYLYLSTSYEILSMVITHAGSGLIATTSTQMEGSEKNEAYWGYSSEDVDVSILLGSWLCLVCQIVSISAEINDQYLLAEKVLTWISYH